MAPASSKLAFGSQPQNGVYGNAVSTFSIDIEDSSGNTITTDSSSIALSIAGGPSGSTLSGTISVQAVHGVATFNNVFVSASGSYTLSAADGSLTSATSAGFSISQATPTVIVSDSSGSYSGAAFSANATVAGVGSQSAPASSLEAVTPTLTYYTGTSASGTPLAQIPSRAGTYTVMASFAGSADYIGASATTTFTISPATLTVAAAGVNKAYDGTTAATVALSDSRVAGDQITDAYTVASFSDKNVGTAKPVSVRGISIGGPDAGNYTLGNTTASTTANITQRPLTIAAVAQNKIYDGTTTVTITLSDNRIAGDQFTDTYASAAFADPNLGTAKAISVSGISISGPDAGNYTFNPSAFTTASIFPSSLTLSNVVSFNGTNGANPQGGLVRDAAGNLYGTTYSGGSSNLGTLFEISNGTLTSLATFTGANGANPLGDLVIDAAGNLYGTTYAGGASNNGTVFEFASGTLATLGSFNGANGSHPQAGLAIDSSGDLFGTTASAGNGNVFEVVKGSGTISVVANFSGSNGSLPQAALTFDPAGNLYGTTAYGGQYNGGTLFTIPKGGNTITDLVSFGSDSGNGPQSGVVIDSAGDIFGTTYSGGSNGNGTVWEFANGALRTLANFNTTNGAGPKGTLILDSVGNLYGTTYGGGSSNSGTVFMIPAGTTSIFTLASLSNSLGSFPDDGLMLDPSGNLFLTASSGGANSHGAVLRLTPPALNVTTAAADITLVQDADHQHIDWFMNNEMGNCLMTDPQGLTFNATGQTNIVFSYANGNPMPAALRLNGTFTLQGLQGTNPFAGTSVEIGRNTVYISYTVAASDPISAIQAYLQNGYNNGGWNGTATTTSGAITSLAAASDPRQSTAIACVDSADGLVSGIPANTIELKYALYGDMSLTGSVGFNQFTRLTQHYNQATGGTWDIGDLNYDGSVNLADFMLLSRTYNQGALVAAPPQTTTAPPSTGINWSSPIVITQGGTYSGNWQSLDPNTPAVTIATSQPVTITNSNIQSMSGLIITSVSGANITVTNTTGWALNPNVAGQSPGRFLDAENFVNVDVEHNTMIGTAGIELGFYQGNGTSSQTVKVLYNQAQNIDGRWSNGSGGYETGPDQNDLVQFCQFNACHNMSGVEVAWNQVINQPGQSRVEDNISVFQSSGTAASPLLIHDNYIQGAYPALPASDASFTGGGIMLSDGFTHSAATDTGFVHAYNNVVIGTSNYGMAISSGHDDTIYNNIIVSSGLLANGTQIASDNIGIYIWNEPSDPYFGNDQEYGNTIGWMGPSGRNDVWLPDVTPSAGQPSDTFLSGGTISISTEQAYFSVWAQRLSSAGLSAGAS